MALGQAARDACRGLALPGRDDDAHAVMATAPHGPAPSVHHEADQEPARKNRRQFEKETDGEKERKREGRERQRERYRGTVKEKDGR